MACGSYPSGGGRRSSSVSHKKNVMISTHIRAVTHQTKHSLYEGKTHISQKEVLYGDKILPRPRQPRFYRDCMPRGHGLPGGALQSSVGVSQGICNEPGCGAPHLQPLLQPTVLHLPWWSLWQPCVSWRLWFAQLTGLLTLQVYKCKPVTSTLSTSSVRFPGVCISSVPLYQA